METDTGLIKHQRVTAMAAQYEKALEEIQAAVKLLGGAHDRLRLEFGDYSGIKTGIFYDLEKQPAQLKKDAWRYILKKSQVTSFLSMKRNKELEQQIEENKLPEITEENILATLQSFMVDSGSLLNETVKEVFDWLLPGRWSDYKTNKKYEIGPKIIKDWMTENYGCGFHIRYGCENELTALDNAFHLLDGKGIRRHPDNLVCGLNTAMKEQRPFEDDMFKAKWYLKGTLHIEFKRLDLLKKLNEVGSNRAKDIGDRERPRGGHKEEMVTV